MVYYKENKLVFGWKSKYCFNKLEGTIFNTRRRDGVRKEEREGESGGSVEREEVFNQIEGRNHHLLYSKHMSE